MTKEDWTTLAESLARPHTRVPYSEQSSCPRAPDAAWPSAPCNCGRDEEVKRIATALGMAAMCDVNANLAKLLGKR